MIKLNAGGPKIGTPVALDLKLGDWCSRSAKRNKEMKTMYNPSNFIDNDEEDD